MSLVNRALFMIERNLHRDLSLGGIAEACGVSRFHLAHAFGEATGVAVMEYVRRRRLTESAYALASGATRSGGKALGWCTSKAGFWLGSQFGPKARASKW